MTVDEISKLTITAISEGFDKATADVNRLTSSTEGLQIMSEKSATSTGKIQSALDKQQRSLDGVYNAQQAYNRSQLVLTQALNSGALSQTRFGELTALNEQRMKRATDAASLFQKETGKIGEVAGVIESRMAGMSASLGVVGEVLSIIGPFGLAAAVGVGALVVAAVKLAESANRMGEWARALQDTSETIGVNTAQLQALDAAAERVGVNAEANAAAFEKFTVNLGALKNGTGSLYTELEKVNPSLVSQLSVTRSNTDAWNLLARAYAHADAQQQALIAHAAFGKGGAAEGRVLTATDQAGGLGGLADQNAAAGFTQQQIALWAQLRAEIATASSEASRNIASIFTGPVLEAERVFANVFVELSQEAKGFSPSDSWHKFIADMTASPAQTFLSTVKDIGKILALGPGLLSSEVRAWAFPPSFDKRASSMFSGPQTYEDLPDHGFHSGSLGGDTTSPGVQVSRQKELISVLGSAATAYDHLKLKKLELDVVQANDNRLVTDEQIARARAAATLDTQIAVESRRLSLLGDMASVTEMVRQKDNELTKARMDGAKFTAQEIADMRARNQLMAESSKLENKLIFDRAQLFKTSADQGVDATLRAAGIPPASDRASAIRDYMRMTDALKQMNDVGGTFASGFLTDISHGVSAVDALHNAMTRLADTLIDMAARQLVTSALGGLASTFLGGGVLPGGAALGLGGIGHAHTGGIIGTDSLATSYVHPAYFDNAPRFHSGGIAGDEVPIIARKGEGVFTPGQMAALGGGGSQTIRQEITFKIDGATGKGEIVAMIQQGMAIATKTAKAASKASLPADMQQHRALAG